MPNSEGIERPEKIDVQADTPDASDALRVEANQLIPTESFGNGSDNTNHSGDVDIPVIEGTGTISRVEDGVLNIPGLSPESDGDSLNKLTLEEPEDDGFRHPMAYLAEEYEGRKPHLETGKMANIPNPGRVAQAHFASLVIQGRGNPDIGSNNGHQLASQLEDNPELFEEIKIDGRDSSDVRAGDIVFGFRHANAGRGHSMVGIVNNQGKITWANSNKDGEIDTVSKEHFFGSPSIRHYVAYRQDLLG